MATTSVLNQQNPARYGDSFRLRFSMPILAFTGGVFRFAYLIPLVKPGNIWWIPVPDYTGESIQPLISTALHLHSRGASHTCGRWRPFTGQAGLGNYLAASTHSDRRRPRKHCNGNERQQTKYPHLSYIDVGLFNWHSDRWNSDWTNYLRDVRGNRQQ